MRPLTRHGSDSAAPTESDPLARRLAPRDYSAIPASASTPLDLHATPPHHVVTRPRRRQQLLRSFLSVGSPPFTRGLVERGANPVAAGALRRAIAPPSAALTVSPSVRPCLPDAPDAWRGRYATTLVTYTEESLHTQVVGSLRDLRAAWAAAEATPGVTVWLSVPAPCSVDTTSFLLELGVPARALHDAAAGVSRAKVETYAHAVTVVAHVPVVGAASGGYELSARQVAMVMLPGKRAVVSLHSGADAAAWQRHVVDMVKADVGGLRRRHVAHLVCAMLDAMLEAYFGTLEHLGNVLDELEWQVLHEDDGGGAGAGVEEGGSRETLPVRLHTRDVLRLISRTKHELGLLRRQMWPLRECLTKLAMTSDELLPNDSRLRVRESLDRTLQVLDVLESYRDVGHSLLDLHLAAQNNRMQEVMQTLAVVTTLFVPLTFLAGIEGMNFKNQPELRGQWSYVVFWVVVFAILVGQVLLFRKKGWI